MAKYPEPRDRITSSRATGFLLGAALVLAGFVFLAMQVLDFRFAIGSVLWPFFVIVPGLFLFVLALVSSGKAGETLAIVGSVVTMVGLLLFYQNSTDQWQNWAYTWALVMPVAVGLGQLLYGSLKGEPDLAKKGMRLSVIGLVIFAVGFFFFEVVIGLSGFGIARSGLARFAWPVLLVGAGGLVMLYTLLADRGSRPPNQGTPQ